MILTIAYFAEPSTPGAQPAILTVANGGLVTHSEALATPRNTADQLQAHSFVIDFPTALLNDMFGMVKGGGRKMARGRAGCDARPASASPAKPTCATLKSSLGAVGHFDPKTPLSCGAGAHLRPMWSVTRRARR